ncbi:MAG: tail fiber protein, partial [bacterium]|nr:tail fiber protein [bacterium]
LIILLAVVFTGCEAGLVTSDSSSEDGSDSGFSFSEMYLSISELKAEIKSLKESVSKASPAGTIMPFAGSDIPQGWLLCDGSSRSTSGDYAALYQAIRNSWGGDAYTFNLPDFRGRFLRGVDGSTGNDPDAANRTDITGLTILGSVVGSYQNDAVVVHSHSTVQMIGDNNVDGVDSTTTRSGDHHNQGRETGDYGGSETRPKNAYVNYIIKY